MQLQPLKSRQRAGGTVASRIRLARDPAGARSDCLLFAQGRELARGEAEELAVDLRVVRTEERGGLDRHLGLSYSAWFNRRHDRVGHLFQGRFKSILFSAPASALELSRYVHLNPVRVGGLGLGKEQRAASRAGTAPAPDPIRWERDWRDCGAIGGVRIGLHRQRSGSALAGVRGTIGRMQQGSNGQAQRERYRQYVEGAIRQGLETTGLWAELKEGAILGSGGLCSR